MQSPSNAHERTPREDTGRGFRIHYVELNDFENNTYLVVHRASGQALLVDAADNAPGIGRLIDRANQVAADADEPEAHMVGVLTTHRHPDHWQALAEIVDRYDLPTYAGAEDAPGIPVATDHLLHDGDRIPLGDSEVECIGLRGHTDGSIALAVRSTGEPVRLLTGDSLFPGGIGNTDDDPQRYEQLLTDVVERIFRRFPDDTVFYPGHGLPSTLGRERGFLNRWRLIGGLPPRNPADDAYRP